MIVFDSFLESASFCTSSFFLFHVKKHSVLANGSRGAHRATASVDRIISPKCDTLKQSCHSPPGSTDISTWLLLAPGFSLLILKPLQTEEH